MIDKQRNSRMHRAGRENTVMLLCDLEQVTCLLHLGVLICKVGRETESSFWKFWIY